MQQFLDQLPFIPPQASSSALAIDMVFWVITAICFGVLVGVTFFITLFTIRYRQGTRVNRVLPHHEGIALEMIWTLIPLVIMLGLFLYSAIVYFDTVRPPKDATEIFVVGKQWMWKIQHPNGRWEMNEIHVPVNKPVKLTMISEDVIHDFGLPAFRQNMDVVPGRYTQMWFNPTRKGRYHIFCAQYCGTNHAIMGGYVTVMDPGEYQKWMETGNLSNTTASKGERLFRDLGCTGCHGPNANVRAPSLAGIYGAPRPIQDTDFKPLGFNDTSVQTTVRIADYRYLHDAIIYPYKEVAAGYKPIMPSFAGRVTEEQVIQLVDYIKTLHDSNGTSNGSAIGYTPGVGGKTEGNAAETSLEGDSRSGRLYGGNPTGDMSDNRDREAALRRPFETSEAGDSVTGRLGTGGSPTGDMANQRDRENIFRGGGAAANTGTLDHGAGGLNNRNTNNRGGLSVYKSENYTKDFVKHNAPGGLSSASPSATLGGR